MLSITLRTWLGESVSPVSLAIRARACLAQPTGFLSEALLEFAEIGFEAALWSVGSILH
ncbi:MAG: hypothetical protein ACI9DF_006104, partial [Verrucomicrobiales bacterium]